MALPRAPRPRWLAIKIEVKNGASDLFPVGTIGFGIEKSEVCHEVLLVVCCQDICDGSLICGIRIERRLAHDRPPTVGHPTFAFENGATVAP
jgi:hypothetical protein